MLAPNTKECPMCQLLALALSDTSRRLYHVISNKYDGPINELLESEGINIVGHFNELEYKLFHSSSDEDEYEIEFFLLTDEQAMEVGLTPLTNDDQELEFLLRMQNKNNEYVPIAIPISHSLTTIPQYPQRRYSADERKQASDANRLNTNQLNVTPYNDDLGFFRMISTDFIVKQIDNPDISYVIVIGRYDSESGFIEPLSAQEQTQAVKIGLVLRSPPTIPSLEEIPRKWPHYYRGDNDDDYTSSYSSSEEDILCTNPDLVDQEH